MAIEWINGSNFTKIATIYDNNITLNNSCIKLVENTRKTMEKNKKDNNQ